MTAVDIPPSGAPVPRSTARSAMAALLLGWAALVIGGGVSGAFMFINLRLAPGLPLFLPATVVWLWLFWRFMNGEGRPRTAATLRREWLRARGLPSRAWSWAMLAGALAVAAAMGLAFMTYRFAALPDEAYRAPFEVATLPSWSVFAVFASLALTAGVVEESAFRGYMLSGFQRWLGWGGGIGLVTILFYVAHLSHAYATLVFLPFFIAHGLVFGLLVFATRSILPGVVLHVVSDFIVLPMQYGVIPSAGQWEFIGQGWMSLVAGAAAIPAFRQLRKSLPPDRR